MNLTTVGAIVAHRDEIQDTAALWIERYTDRGRTDWDGLFDRLEMELDADLPTDMASDEARAIRNIVRKARQEMRG